MPAALRAFVEERQARFRLSGRRLAARAGYSERAIRRWFKTSFPRECLASLTFALASADWPDANQDSRLIDAVRANGLDAVLEADSVDQREKERLADLFFRMRDLLDTSSVHDGAGAVAAVASGRLQTVDDLDAWTDPWPEGMRDIASRTANAELETARVMVERVAHGGFVTFGSHAQLLKAAFRSSGDHELKAACTSRDTVWWVSGPGCQIINHMAAAPRSVRIDRIFTVEDADPHPVLTDAVMQLHAAAGVRVHCRSVAELPRGGWSNLLLIDGRVTAIGDGRNFTWSTSETQAALVEARYIELLQGSTRVFAEEVVVADERFDAATMRTKAGRRLVLDALAATLGRA